MVVYFDDLLMTGPIKTQPKVWEKSREIVNTEDPESLDRFLGRAHLLDDLDRPVPS